MGRLSQAREEVGTLWAQAVDRGNQEATHHNGLAIALANKLARIAWAVLARGSNFEMRRSNELSTQPA